jgi:hypothetical protein
MFGWVGYGACPLEMLRNLRCSSLRFLKETEMPRPGKIDSAAVRDRAPYDLGATKEGGHLQFADQDKCRRLNLSEFPFGLRFPQQIVHPARGQFCPAMFPDSGEHLSPNARPKTRMGKQRTDRGKPQIG